MKVKQIGKLTITYDPFVPQLINNHYYSNTGSVIVKKRNDIISLETVLPLSGGDMLGYRILELYNIFCVYAKGSSILYIFDKNNLKFISGEKLPEAFYPYKLIFVNNNYYIKSYSNLFSQNTISLNISEEKTIYFLFFMYKWYLLALLLIVLYSTKIIF